MEIINLGRTKVKVSIAKRQTNQNWQMIEVKENQDFDIIILARKKEFANYLLPEQEYRGPVLLDEVRVYDSYNSIYGEEKSNEIKEKIKHGLVEFNKKKKEK